MDLTSAAINFTQATLSTKVQYAVARKLLDSQQSQGAAIVNMVQNADINQDNAADQLVSAACGLGGLLDVTG